MACTLVRIIAWLLLAALQSLACVSDPTRQRAVVRVRLVADTGHKRRSQAGSVWSSHHAGTSLASEARDTLYARCGARKWSAVLRNSDRISSTIRWRPLGRFQGRQPVS